ncbi:MAG: TolC family protein [Desulfobacterales bacterium]|nr:TolC family protein [Desulfobacterales bacterium]
MSKYIFHIWGGFILICLPMLCHAQYVMTLEDCLEFALKNNPSIKAADYAVAALEENRKSVRADFLPALSSSYTFSRVSSESEKGSSVETDYLDQYARSFSITLSQTLYAGSRIVNTYDKVKIEKEKKIADKKLAQLELAFNIQNTFFKLMKAIQDVKIIADSVERLQEGVKSARAYLEKELVAYTEVLTAQVDLADAEQQLSISKNDVNRMRVTLFSLMNMPVSNTVIFTGGMGFFPEAYPSDFDRSWQVALQNRPDLESLQKEIAVAKKESEIALGSYLPLVTLNLGYHDQNRDFDEPGQGVFGQNVDRDQRNRYWSAGVTASWEFFDGGRAWYRKTRSDIVVRQVEEMIKETQLILKEGIRKALFSISEAKLRIKDSQQAVSAATENYKVEKRRLEAGLTTIPRLLDAQVRLTRASGNHTQAMLDYQLGRSELAFMMGETYDKVDN